MIPADTELTPRDAAFPAWDDLPDNLKAFYARQMEVYAGFSENADYNVGRVIDAIEELGELDNTLILWIWGDNGASMEGTITGSFNELTMQNGIPLTDEMQLQLSERYGGLDAVGRRDHGPALLGRVGVGGEHAVPVGQAGRIAPRRDPQPDGRALAGSHPGRAAACAPSSPTSSTWRPTILELAGIPEPDTVDGIEQEPMHGSSFAASLTDGAAARASHPAVLRDHRQPGHVQGRLVARDEDGAHPVGAHARCAQAVRARGLGPGCGPGRAVLPARRLLAGEGPRRRPPREGPGAQGPVLGGGGAVQGVAAARGPLDVLRPACRRSRRRRRSSSGATSRTCCRG